MAKSKSSKAVSSMDVVNPDLQASFEAVMNLEAEVAVYEKALKMLGVSISVRGLKATIEASEEKGALPTIKPSTAQYFPLSGKVRELSGGKDKPLKTILNATIQATRAWGKEEAEKRVAGSKSFAEFAKTIPSQAEQKRNKAKSKVTADSLLKAYIDGVKGLKDIAPTDADLWTQFFKVVESQRKAIIAKHPSAKAKAA